jgi:hypothetical protein
MYSLYSRPARPPPCRAGHHAAVAGARQDDQALGGHLRQGCVRRAGSGGRGNRDGRLCACARGSLPPRSPASHPTPASACTRCHPGCLPAGIFANWLVGLATWQANAAQVRPARPAPALRTRLCTCPCARRPQAGLPVHTVTSVPHTATLPRLQHLRISVSLPRCLAVRGAQDLTGKAVGIWLPISAFAMIGFEHSIANM